MTTVEHTNDAKRRVIRKMNAPLLDSNDTFERKQGGCVLGYKLNKHIPRTRQQHRAAKRLSDLGRLDRLRQSQGVCHPRVKDWLYLVANAVLVKNGKNLVTAGHVDLYIGKNDRDAVTEEMLENAARDAVMYFDGLVDNEEAGKLANLDLAELLAIQDQGVVLTMHPIDETADEREERRKERDREVRRRRKREERAAKKLEVASSKAHDLRAKVATASLVAKVANTVPFPLAILHGDTVATFELVGRPGKVATSELSNDKCRLPWVCGSCVRGYRVGVIPQRDQVIAAIRDGAATISQIISVTGLPQKTVKPLLSRLVKTGSIERPSRGRYLVKGTLEQPATSVPEVELMPNQHTTMTSNPMVTSVPLVGMGTADLASRASSTASARPAPTCRGTSSRATSKPRSPQEAPQQAQERPLVRFWSL